MLMMKALPVSNGANWGPEEWNGMRNGEGLGDFGSTGTTSVDLKAYTLD